MPSHLSDERRKELGAFYTPPQMASKLVDWCLRSPNDTMLDPSFGGFVFLEMARQRLLALGAEPEHVGRHLCGIDVDDEAIRIARSNGLADCRLMRADFFKVAPAAEMRFTANIGNPPYVRYQAWNGDASGGHRAAEAVGVRLTRLSSTWAPFLLHGCQFLTEGGRLGQVLPAELLHSQYARPVIDFLAESFQAVTVAVFEEKIFPGALEEVVLLFADGYRRGPAKGVGVIACRNLDDLRLDRIDGKGRGFLNSDVALLRLLPRGTQKLYEELALANGVTTLGAVAEVDIGVVTGANDFFLRARDEMTALSVDGRLLRTTISKATDIAGARISRADVKALDANGRRTALLVLDEATACEVASIRSLIREGEKAGLHKRYKCRIRKPWYAVPLPAAGKQPDAFLTYMNNAFPRLVLNEAKALSTNTIHNVWLRADVEAKTLTVAFYNSLTLLSAELVGRSYGGGILKLEPTEAERLLLPRLSADVEQHLERVDRALRCGDLTSTLDLVDAAVLKPLGLTDAEIAGLRRARQKLLARRRARNMTTRAQGEENSSARNRRAAAAR